jgi:hypothetical protein
MHVRVDTSASHCQTSTLAPANAAQLPPAIRETVKTGSSGTPSLTELVQVLDWLARSQTPRGWLEPVSAHFWTRACLRADSGGCAIFLIAG